MEHLVPVSLDQQHTRLSQEPLPAPVGLIPHPYDIAHNRIWPHPPARVTSCNRTSTPTAQEHLPGHRPTSLERHHSSCPGVPAGACDRLAHNLRTASLSTPHLLALCLPSGQRLQLSSPRARHLLREAQTPTFSALRDCPVHSSGGGVQAGSCCPQGPVSHEHGCPPSGSPSRRFSRTPAPISSALGRPLQLCVGLRWTIQAAHTAPFSSSLSPPPLSPRPDINQRKAAPLAPEALSVEPRNSL